MLAGRSWESWIAEYSEGHQHPLNRLTHTFGIPIILISLPLFLAGIVWHRVLWAAVVLFVAGWALQFLGHAPGRLALVGRQDPGQRLKGSRAGPSLLP